MELTPGPDLHEAVAFSRRTGLPPVATTRAIVSPSSRLPGTSTVARDCGEHDALSTPTRSLLFSRRTGSCR